MKSIESWIITHWYTRQKTWLAYLLWPLSKIFYCVAKIRRSLYQKHWLKTYRAPCPVIVIGNISVGGVGKTPLVIALYFFLKERGWTPGIITRGYKGSYSGVVWVSADANPCHVGDEAVLLAARTNAPMVVARDRVDAIKVLLQSTTCDIILSDDGLQHYAMERDLEIAVVDASKQQGNKLCLPAGPLREPISRLESVDLVVVNGGDESQYSFALQGTKLLNVVDPSISQSVDVLHGKKIHAVTGIGSPQRFFDYLKSFGAEVVSHIYPDHYFFQEKDFQIFSEQDKVVMTEKDAVKCRAFVKDNVWFLPVEARFNFSLILALENYLRNLRKICK